MRTFFRANIASLIASVCDFLITIFAVRFLYADVVVAGITGTICGGLINFLIGRFWAFAAKESNGYEQAVRYLVVWVGNLLLNAGGLYLLAKVAGIYYVAAKLITSLVVSVAYNYPLQKKFVFRNSREGVKELIS